MGEPFTDEHIKALLTRDGVEERFTFVLRARALVCHWEPVTKVIFAHVIEDNAENSAAVAYVIRQGRAFDTLDEVKTHYSR